MNLTHDYYALSRQPFKKYTGQLLVLLQGFHHLQANWDGYDALPPSKVAIQAAEELVHALDRLETEVYFIAPGPNGEISVELQQGHRSLEFLFFLNRPAKFLLFEGKEFVKQGLYQEIDLGQLLLWLHP